MTDGNPNPSLNALEAYTRDVGRGVARIDYESMFRPPLIYRPRKRHNLFNKKRRMNSRAISFNTAFLRCGLGD